MSARAALYDAAHGALILDAANRIEACTTSTGRRGYGDAQLTIRDTPLDEQLRIAARAQFPALVVGQGEGSAYEGRVEDVPIGGSALALRAFGYARSLDDLPYTAMWSDARTGAWRPIQDSERGDALPDRWVFNTTNRLYMAAIKNSSLSSTTNAYLIYQTPASGGRDIVGVDFSFEMTLPSATWRLQLLPITTGFSAGAAIFTLAGTGAAQTGARHLTFAATPWLAFQVQYNAAAAVFGGETGSAYAEILNLRLVTSTTNRVNTTLTAARAAGAGVTATVGSTARMYAGQKLVVRDSGSAFGEVVTVTSVTNSTQFVATFANNYAINATVQAQVIYGDEIVRDAVAAVAALNATQLSPATGLIQSPAMDLLTETYEDAAIPTVLDRLASYGDTAGAPWGWSVGRDKVLAFEARGQRGYTWYVDAAADQIQIERSADDLATSAYATYQEASGRTLRTAVASSAAAIAAAGVDRRRAVSAQTTSATQAGLIRDTALADAKSPQPRIRVTVDAVFDAGGARVPLWAPDAGRGDTIVIRNLSPVLPGNADQLRRFRLGYASIDWVAGTLTLESEAPPAGLAALFAREEART